MKTNNRIAMNIAHLEKASNLLGTAAEDTKDEVHVVGLRRLSIGLAQLRAPLERIAASLKLL